MRFIVFTTSFILLTILQYFGLIAQWHVVDTMHVARSGHKATLLNNNNVLITGGLNSTGSLNSCEIYNPTLSHWTVITPMSYRRFGHSATLLLNGKVLVAGGYDYQTSTYLRTCELYDPTADSWSLTDSMHTKRSGHTATLLDDSRVLVVGGDYSRTCEIYDPLTSKWFEVDSTHRSRMGHSATKLEDGRVIIIGSRGVEWDKEYFLATCEMFNLRAISWSFSDSMKYARANHSTALLLDGKLFVSGGLNGDFVRQCEVYDPVSNVWSLSDSLHQPRVSHCSVTLLGGEVLIIGGQYGTDPQSDYHALKSCELRLTNGAIILGDSLVIARYGHDTILLYNGDVLVTGGAQGLHFNRTYLSSCEVYSKRSNGIHNRGSEPKPLGFQLENNYPNPFNPSTTIYYTLSEPSYIVLNVFDVLGREITTLVDGMGNSGTAHAIFDATGKPSGVYFYRIQVGQYSETKCMLVLK